MSHLFSAWRHVLVGVVIGATTIASVGISAQTPKRATAAKSVAPATVRSVSRTPLPRGERITIELTSEVLYTGDRVSNPDRVYFDFHNSRIAAAAVASAKALRTGATVSGVRLGQFTPNSTRLVLDLTGQPRYSAFPMYSPFRLVIDIESEPVAGMSFERPAVARPSSPTVELPAARLPAPPSNAEALVVPAASESASVPDPPAASPAPPPVAPVTPAAAPAVAAAPAAAVPPPDTISAKVSTSPAMRLPMPASRTPPPAAVLTRGHDYSLARQLGLGIARVVIDPGHGGQDPGAKGVGVIEAELVLDVALRLEKLLKEQQGVEVVLTRRTDEFIPLEERTEIANREGADLFLSIHANASTRPAARGVETYFLNFATSPDAEAVAARENATSGRNMGRLPDLVKTIALNNKVVESRELATVVQRSMATSLSVQNKSLRNLGVKQAPFVVLIGAQMPSILAEISFVTNKAEAKLLKQASYRQRIAQSLANGVLKYQSSLKRSPTMAVKVQGQ